MHARTPHGKAPICWHQLTLLQVDGCLDLYLEYACKGGHAAVVNLLLSQAKPAGAPDRDKMVRRLLIALARLPAPTPIS